MIDQRRWMIRPGTSKQPISALAERPEGYVEDGDPNDSYWSYRWNLPSIWADYETAAARVDESTGLSYVLHPAGDNDEAERIVCFDFDGCFTNDRVLDPDVLDLLEFLNSFTEFSQSGRGLHCFVKVTCPAFVNLRARPIGTCKVDILCQAQVAVTGIQFRDFDDLGAVPVEFLNSLDCFEFKPLAVTADAAEWDDEADIDAGHLYLYDMMAEWPAAIQGQAGSATLFAAACRLLEHGVDGNAAVTLLAEVDANPAFSPAELQRTVMCARQRVAGEGALSTKGPVNEFEVIDVPRDTGDEPIKRSKYGFEPVRFDKLEAMDLRLDFLVDRMFVGEGSMFVGGQEKTFKTGVTVDLLISLATGSKFLGEFEINDRRSSVIFTAEIGLPTAQRLNRRICQQKGVDPSQIDCIDVVDTIPSFLIDKRTGLPTNVDAMRGLRRYFAERRPDVAVFDPLYFAMGGAAVGDMYEIGAVLNYISKLCNDYGIWAIFCHHSRKPTKDEVGRPMQLNDLYGSGVGAYARQWFLLSHAAPYANGRATLYANVGGSAAGDRGIWELNIDEGDSDVILDRRWDVSIAKREAESSIVGQHHIEEAIKALGNGKGASLKDVAWYVGAAESALDGLIREMVQSGIIEMLPGKKFELRENGDF
jgi:hypothetical protein